MYSGLVPIPNPFLRLAQPPRAPGIQITLYYLLLGSVVGAVLFLFPGLADYISIGAGESTGWGRGADVFEPVGPNANGAAGGAGTAVSLLLSMAAALLLMIPVSWVYMGTRLREGYDGSVAQVILILPIAMAGIVVVVQNSIPLAFSLAGIVAIIRFRTTLKDTADALFLFAAVGVGLSAGIGALLVAVVISLFFNYTNLMVWKLDYGREGARKRKGKKAKKNKLEEPQHAVSRVENA